MGVLRYEGIAAHPRLMFLSGPHKHQMAWQVKLLRWEAPSWDVAQVIVMSHDSRFLRDLWDQELPTDERKALWLLPFGHKDIVIAEWPIETDTSLPCPALQFPAHKRGSGLRICAIEQIGHRGAVPFASTSRSDASHVQLPGHGCERERAGSADGLDDGN
jgi:hypothetical protein